MLGRQAQEGERQADLVVLVALAPQRRPARGQDRRGRLLRGGLGDAPGDPDDERVEPGAPGRRDARAGRRAGRRPGRRSRRRGAASAGSTSRATHEQRPPPRRDGVGQEAVAVGALARAGRRRALPGSTRRESTAPPRIGRSERRRSVPAGRPRRGRRPTRASGSPDVAGGAGPVSVTGGSVAQAAAHGPGVGLGRRGSAGARREVERRRSASVAIRRKSSNDSTGISRCPCADDRRRALLDPDGDDELRRPVRPTNPTNE